jgi:hypothetical protein
MQSGATMVIRNGFLTVGYLGADQGHVHPHEGNPVLIFQQPPNYLLLPQQRCAHGGRAGGV